MLDGLLEALVITFLGSSWTCIVISGPLIAVLAATAGGLFGAARLEKV